MGLPPAFLFVVAASAVFSIWLFIVYLASTFWRKAYKDAPRAEEHTFAVLVPTYNDDAAPAVLSCLSADYPKEKINIYIVDDSTDEDIAKANKVLAEKHKNVFWLRRDELRKGFKAGALNYALGKIKGEDIVVVLDADGEVEKEFFRKMSGAFKSDVDAVQAKWAPASKKHTLLSYFAWIYPSAFHSLFVPVLNFFKSSLIFGNGFGVRREVLERIRFDESFVAEDFKLALDIIQSGGKVVMHEGINVRVTQPKDLKNMDRQFTRWAYGGAQVVAHVLRNAVVNPAALVVLLIWISSAVVIPGVVVATFWIMVEYGWVVTSLPFILGVYVLGLLPLFMLTYFLSEEPTPLPVHKKLLAQLLCFPLGMFFYMKGLFKFLKGEKLYWVPTEKVV